MFRELVRLRNRNQLTLPTEITRQLGLEPGSLLELIVSDAGHVELRHAHVVTAGTPEAQREEAMAEENIQQGRYVTLNGSEGVREYMRQQRLQEYTRKMAEKVAALQQRMHSIHAELNDTQTAIEEIKMVEWANIPGEKV
jgi:AbrB family looped-hinge helix DNA binding protein